ncbi:protein DpdJ [Candidatus Viridilinea mediisalina]|uniref:DEAD/DEAH box helicase n=1 Tax=Candidatus Viridilinea mediisalina TaxID=2024553 RepID=A0A2A6RIA3_9CHLR|nr:protein DpdJ [Candidatus Viridilinea mediisalina]PDW02615.1 hypothetical protein CJ255_13080 [Candidatus Viridilinea mediisalina]
MVWQPLSQAEVDRLAGEVLTLIELAESSLLSWGFVQVQHDLDAELPTMLDKLSAVGRALWTQAQATGLTPNDLLANLKERKLIFKNRQGLYRSRFAEAVRLLFLLRQMLPHTHWQAAPRLVSDLRLQLQRRRYPRRDVAVADLIAALESRDANALELAVVEALLSDANGLPLHLARFQLEATLRQVQALRERRDYGLVIGAGTGAGKTKAFYLPALAQIASTLDHDESWTKVVAIYPRIELLKDQLAEAFREARKLDALLHNHGKPSMVVAAYYGDTPTAARWLLTDNGRRTQGWKLTPARDGWIFPTMPCPTCRGDLVWRKEDVKAEVRENEAQRYGQYARLICAKCGLMIGSDQLVLTRAQMKLQPPDLLFTTTEMLNRRLSRREEHALFGIGVRRPPRLMLLDEIHTYEGMGGAQVAHLLRRWRHARGRMPGQGLVMVGLSATLSQAETFFARLTGLAIEQVGYITPAEADLVEEGVEYNLVLKGDPVSGTSLLSTSVQTAMLLGRVLDTPWERPGGACSRGAYGQKIFAFTDTLDVINRWYHIEQDAETNQVLSAYRKDQPTATREERQRRNEAGQWWWACEQIGHDLEAPLSLDLTSSQYRGVRADANLVVATSTLEVGFNDPAVGAVIQHKAPRSLASFLQRKGRAGRTRIMRPWMVVVTSAYGRDRWAFQHAEHLFNPLLPPLDLPLENIYVRKMQAAFALMDWLTVQLPDRPQQPDLWAVLSNNPQYQGRWSSERRAIARLLNEILEGGPARNALEIYLDAALGLEGDATTLATVLWAEPRPLLLDVIPTLLRQLETNWRRIEQGTATPWADTQARDPLPDFVTPNLFSLLSLPELTLHLPEKATPDTAMRPDEQMGLVQGMVEFTPGHVSKRYARSNRIREAHWLALPDDAKLDGGRLQLADLAVERDPSARRIEIDGESILVYRPQAYNLAIIPASVLPTSSARLRWGSRFDAQSRGRVTDAIPAITLEFVPDSPWRKVFVKFQALTQATGSWVEVTRAALGLRAETRLSNGRQSRRRLRFAEGETPAALGFSLSVDALQAEFVPLEVEPVLDGPDWPNLRQHLVPAYLRFCLGTDPRLVALELSDFELDWLWQLELSMLVATAVVRSVDLATAAAEAATKREVLAARTMDVIFQSQRASVEDDEPSGRLRERITALLSEPDVIAALNACNGVLWAAPDAAFATWLQACYASSLGAVLLDAVTRIVPELNPDDLTLDVVGQTIWIAEQTPGGVGLIQRIAEAISRRPRDLETQLLDTLRHCDRELLASQLATVARLCDADDAELGSAFAQARQATNFREQLATLRTLGAALEPHGLPATRDLVIALNSKFLRPSSDRASDDLVAALAKRWEEEQRRLGCAIDLRVMAVAAWSLDDLRAQVELVLERIGAAPLEESQVFNLLQSLLWLDCRDSCPDCIERHQPYQGLVKPSRALLRACLDPASESIRYAETDWQERLLARLTERDAAQVVCTQADLPALHAALSELVVTPLEVGFQYHYPSIERVERRSDGWMVGLVLRERVQR